MMSPGRISFEVSPAPGRMWHAQTLPEVLQLGLQLLPLGRQLLLLSHQLLRRNGEREREREGRHVTAVINKRRHRRADEADAYPHGVRDLFGGQAEVVVLGFQLPALTVQHLTLDGLLWKRHENDTNTNI